MLLPRLHLLELHEQSWMIPALREDLQSSLSSVARALRIYERVLVRVGAWLQRIDACEMLDLCSGAGGPAMTLVEAFLSNGQKPPRITLSDLYPHREAMQAACDAHHTYIAAEFGSVDATHVDAVGLDARGCPRVRSLIACFHHFSPPMAKKILADAVAANAPILILEPMTRDLATLLRVAVGTTGLMPLLRLLQEPLSLALWARLPLLFPMCFFDGAVSVLRTYSIDELRTMAAEVSNRYDWQIGVDDGFAVQYASSLHRVTYCMGTPPSLLGSGG